MGCGGQFIADVETEDKINLLVAGKYYGHPNAKRAAVHNDTRQCVWRSPTSQSDASYNNPLIIMKSSTDGIIEYQADHFGKQMRGNLIASKYTAGLFRVILSADGQTVISQSNPPLTMQLGDQGLDVTQAPNGNLIKVRLGSNLCANAVFPCRGGVAYSIALTGYGVH